MEDLKTNGCQEYPIVSPLPAPQDPTVSRELQLDKTPTLLVPCSSYMVHCTPSLLWATL